MRKVIFDTIVIGVMVLFIGFGHYTVIKFTNVFIELREADARLFSELVRENWEGIRTISEEEKQTLLRNLEPEFAATDIKSLRLIIVVFINVIGIAIVADRVISIGKTLWASRHNKSLKDDAASGGAR